MYRTASLILVGFVLFGLCWVAVEEQRSAGPTNETQIRPVFTSTDPRAVFSADIEDPWNRIFRLLFTRTIKARISDDFPEGAPFASFTDGLETRLRASTRVIDQNEIGDRAIEPLYPSFLTDVGVLELLKDPNYPEFFKMVDAALKETTTRPPLARALMQSDVWAAYDLLFGHKGLDSRGLPEAGRKRDELLPLLARFVRKLALNPREISELPKNYEHASGLPALFSHDSGWIEIQLLPHRLHDFSSGFRRETRVFIKSKTPSMDPFAFAESLKGNQDVANKAAAVALVVQNLLIDSNDRVVPSPIISTVQIRDFSEGGTVREFELSRRLLLTGPSSDGFVEHGENSTAYRAIAGNDYGFATPMSLNAPAVIVKLKTRCASCHGKSLATLMTYSLHDPPELQPPVTILDVSKNQRGRYTADEKEKREDFKALLRNAYRSP